MRMRKKHNLDSRWESCLPLMEEAPSEIRGRWREKHSEFDEIRLEIGCGKGTFTVETAKINPDILIVALEKEQSAMVMAMEKVIDAGVKNVVFIDGDAARLGDMFAPGEVDMIYLNFSDPWPKSRDAKFRLTAPVFLRSYADVLSEGGEIQFKTDNSPLFEWSCRMFEDEGWELSELTYNLHENGPLGIMTDYESRFYAQGVKINRVVAVRNCATRNSSAGIPQRLRNAALSDARGIRNTETC